MKKTLFMISSIIIISTSLVGCLNLVKSNEVHESVKAVEEKIDSSEPTIIINNDNSTHIDNSIQNYNYENPAEITEINNNYSFRNKSNIKNDTESNTYVSNNNNDNNNIPNIDKPTPIEKPEYNIIEILLGPRRDKASIYPVGHPVICGECGTEGGLHKDIMEWKDKDGLWHYTHYDCVNNYVDRTGYTPYNPSAILH